VISKPNDKPPARPVSTKEQKHPEKYREKPDEANQEKIIIKGGLGLEVVGVVYKSDDTSGYEYPTDDGDGAWTFAQRGFSRFGSDPYCSSSDGCSHSK
jgi:hypothetical protein